MTEVLRWTIGDVEVIRIEESCLAYPAEMLIKQATPEVIARHADWLRPHFVDERGRLFNSVHGLLVRSDGLNIMVDTCIGPHMPGATRMGSMGDH